MKEGTVYLVLAFRIGDVQEYTYPVGIFTDLEKAIECAQEHRNRRGGKYNCVVSEHMLNAPFLHQERYKEIYRAAGIKQ